MERYGLHEQQVHISHSGLSEEFINTPSLPMTTHRRNRLLFVGQNAFYKGVNCLGRIVSEVLRKHPQTTMTWVCNATDHTSGLSLFDPDVQDRVRMIGWGSQTELIEILDRHGVFVFPTLAEGFAKAPLEAMSRGLIVIASDCCGMRDYMSDHTSQLCEVGNVQQFSERVGRALSGAFDTNSSGTVEAARQHTWKASAEKILEFIRQRIQTARP